MSFQRVETPPPSSHGLRFKPQWYWYAGGSVVAFFVWRHFKASQQTAADTSAGAVSTDGSTAYDDQSNYGGYGPTYGTTPSLYGYTDPTTGAFIGGTGSTPVVTAPTTNAQYFQQANAYLVAQGYDELLIGTTFGKWVSGTAMTQNEYNTAEAAIAFQGAPPQTIPAPHVTPPTGQTPTPTPAGVSDGWYQDQVTRNIYQVANGVRFHYASTAWNKIASKPKLSPVYPTWAGYKLPYGGVYT